MNPQHFPNSLRTGEPWLPAAKLETIVVIEPKDFTLPKLTDLFELIVNDS